MSLKNLRPNYSILLSTLTLVYLLLVATISYSAPTEITDPIPGAYFDTLRAMYHVNVLASDSFGGRYCGFEGGEKAARYLADHFKKVGLEAPFGKDGYFQPFTYAAGDYKMPTYLVIRYENGKTDSAHFWKEINIYKGSGIGKAKAKLVFIGYGVCAPEKGWDDYSGIDVKGCVVIGTRGTPDVAGVRWNDEGVAARKAIQAKKHGALAYLQIDDGVPRLPAIFGDLAQSDFPVFDLGKAFGDSILVWATGKTSDQFKSEIKKDHKPKSMVTNAVADLQISGKFYPKRPLRNVAGLLPAFDPKNRNELIVIGGHYDHHGTDPAGNIYHGGNDNASGTATVMELAEMFAKSGKHYNRSILFIGFTAEEEGLLGSQEFVKQLKTNGYKVAAMINMDVVGTGGDTLGIGGIAEWPEIGQAKNDSLPVRVRKKLQYWRLYPGSDHTSFDDEGIPAFVVGTVGGVYETYHTPNDTAGTVFPSSLKKVGDLVYRLTETATNLPQTITASTDANRKALHFMVKTGALQVSSIHEVGTKIVHPEKMKGLRPFYPVSVVLLDTQLVKPLPEVMNFIGESYQVANKMTLPVLTDSIRKDFPKIDAYRGIMFGIPYQAVTDLDENGFKMLQKLGVNFLFVDDEALAPDGKNRDDWMTQLSQLHKSITAAKMCIIVGNSTRDRMLQISNQFKERVILGINDAGLDSAFYSKLQANKSLALVGLKVLNKKEFITTTLKQLVSTGKAKNIAIYATPSSVQSCWDAGFTNYDLQSLLYYNFKNYMDQFYPPPPETGRHY